jgi:hypothetical protein
MEKTWNTAAGSRSQAMKMQQRCKWTSVKIHFSGPKLPGYPAQAGEEIRQVTGIFSSITGIQWWSRLKSEIYDSRKSFFGGTSLYGHFRS